MNALDKLHTEIGGVDIYLLDQILKGRYLKDDVILDAGCGSGRNLKWFHNSNYTVYGVDTDSERLAIAQESYQSENTILSNQSIDNLSFESNFFNHIICNAVLHFATSKAHFLQLFDELVRVLKPGGSLFIRMTSNFGIEQLVENIPNKETHFLPDETERFLLTRDLLNEIQNKHHFNYLEPIKTVNVDNLRSMTTLVFEL